MAFYDSNFPVLHSWRWGEVFLKYNLRISSRAHLWLRCSLCLSDALAGEMEGFNSPEDGCRAICAQPSERLPSLELPTSERFLLQQG